MTTGSAASQERAFAADVNAEAGVHSDMVGSSMPLTMLRPGQTACVDRVLAAGNGMAGQLRAMGIVPGVRVTVLNAQSGPLILRVGESRYAVGRGMAQRMMVVPCQSPVDRLQEQPSLQ